MDFQKENKIVLGFNRYQQFLIYIKDAFCARQFDKTQQAATQIDYDQNQFAEKINIFFNSGTKLHDGYAAFCKHLFVPNFTTTKLQVEEITDKNRHLLITKYEARTEKELPVLRRYFLRKDIPEKTASFLDIILYSKEQIKIENDAMKNIDINESVPYEWGIISVKPQNCDYEIPMDPITMMRNALGIDQGGSGITLKREEYMKSVKFWEKYALIK